MSPRHLTMEAKGQSREEVLRTRLKKRKKGLHALKNLKKISLGKKEKKKEEGG